MEDCPCAGEGHGVYVKITNVLWEGFLLSKFVCAPSFHIVAT